MRFSEYIKTHRYSIITLAITSAVSVFMGGLGVRMVKLAAPKNSVIVHDTVYVKPSMADSLLQDISEQVAEINSKIPERKPIGKKRVIKKDTIKVDATIHIDKIEQTRNP